MLYYNRIPKRDHNSDNHPYWVQGLGFWGCWECRVAGLGFWFKRSIARWVPLPKSSIRLLCGKDGYVSHGRKHYTKRAQVPSSLLHGIVIVQLLGQYSIMKNGLINFVVVHIGRDGMEKSLEATRIIGDILALQYETDPEGP